MKGDFSVKTLTENYEAYMKRADQVLNTVAGMASSGHALKAEDLRAKEFYEDLKHHLEDFKTLFV
jgi:hypothetical protein